ncbi:MAG: TIGR00282 family metallophosphoesterase [Geminicoccaceae bacterium]|nr:TIGR00282 family metallophosphoesterase [Geminicoccaceae bacterium]
MRILFCGDVVGRSGRRVLLDHLANLRGHLDLDLVVVNGENAAGGFGITPTLCREFYAAGADVVTTGNHVFDQRDLIPEIDRDPRLIRPLNMLVGTPGRGLVELTLDSGQRVVVAQVMGRLFMGMYDDPFAALEAALAKYVLGAGVAAIVVDLHAEATSEKMAIGHFLDGRVTLVAGTHTHVPTADAQVLPGGTAYITDVGMTGDYDSVIGMVKEVSLRRFRSHLPGARNAPAMGEATLCAVLVESDDVTGRATSVRPIRLGGRLQPAAADA